MTITRILLIVLALLVFVAVCYAVFQWIEIQRAVQTSKKLFAVAVPYTQNPADAAMHILVVGDSTAVGTGVSDPHYSVAGRLGSYYPKADVENSSKNGLRLAELDSRLQTLPDTHYDLMVIQIGANDITMFTSLKSVRDSLKDVLAWATSHSSRVIVITAGNVGLSPVFHWPLSAFITHRTLQVRSIFMQEIAAYSTVTYIDLFKSAKDEPFNKDIPRYYAPDHFHPSDDGYGLWFERIQVALL